MDIFLFLVQFILIEMTKGIVIDSFSTLREEKNAKTEDREGVCFICGLNRVLFERQIDREAFDLHTENFHHMWNYFYFIIYLWEQEKDDDDGLEHDIRAFIENNDISWFPMNKAMQLQHVIVGHDEDTLESKFYRELGGMEDRVAGNISNFSGYMNKSIEKVTRIVEDTHNMLAPKRTRAGGTRSKPQTGIPLQHGKSMGDLLPENTRRNSFKATQQFLELEEYISIRCLSVIGIQLPEGAYSALNCKILSPTHEFTVHSTDYSFGPLLPQLSLPYGVNAIVDSSMDLDDTSNVDLDDNGSLSSAAYMTNDVEVVLDSRYIVLHKDDRSKLLREPWPVSIKIVYLMNSNDMFPKLLGTISLDLHEIMNNLNAVVAELPSIDKELKESEVLNAENLPPITNSLNVLASIVKKPVHTFPITANGDVRITGTTDEITEMVQTGGKVQMEISFPQRNAISKHCILRLEFVNHFKNE